MLRVTEKILRILSECCGLVKLDHALELRLIFLGCDCSHRHGRPVALCLSYPEVEMESAIQTIV